MANFKKPHFMTFGPPIPIVPVGDFSRRKLTEKEWAEVWSICGPSAEQNMRRGRRGGPMEQWQVIASAYLEGLQHGYEFAKENPNDDSGEIPASGNGADTEGADQPAGYLC